jgi:site-specific recombinase XerD
MEWVWRTRVTGPLSPYADGLRSELVRRGYTRLSAEHRVWMLGHLSRWLTAEGLEPSQLSQDRIKQFLTVFGANWRPPLTERKLAPMLIWLRDRNVVPPLTITTCSTPLDQLLKRYHDWLAGDRCLAARTVGRYEVTARRFLEGHQRIGGATGVQGLSGTDVTSFLLGECSRLAVGSAKGRVTELRSLLRFLHLEGLTAMALANAVPPVAGWHDTRLPSTLSISSINALLNSCDRTRPIGVRDFAILTLLARLGLRAAEVAGLELDDVDWRAGEIVIRGKSRRDDRLPLPVDVGEALVAYLTEARPQVESRRLFLSSRAPLGGLWPTAVSQVVCYACLRAHLTPVRAHALRHALATEMLRQGAPLTEISQVLRHRDLATTAVYAKVDWVALRTVAQPWPGGDQ